MMQRGRGFTLVELIIAVAIVAVLAMLAAPMLEVSAVRQKETELRTALRDIRSAIDSYKQAVNDNRIRVADDASGYPPDLAALAEGVPDVSQPDLRRIYFLRRVPRDPFFPDPSIPAEQTWGKRNYASPPDSPQEGNDVYDVYSLSDKAGLNGVPYREW